MDRINQLEREVSELKAIVLQLASSASLPLSLEQALVGRGFIKTGGLNGILKSSGSVLSSVTPYPSQVTYYVAASSGGPVTAPVTFRDGIYVS